MKESIDTPSRRNSHKPKSAESPVRRFSELRAGERVYKLCYDFGALRRAEKQSGLNLLAALGRLSELDLTQFTALLAAAIEPAQPGFTVEDAEDLLSSDFGLLVTAIQALGEAYRLSMPEVNPHEAPAAVVAAASEGDI